MAGTAKVRNLVVTLLLVSFAILSFAFSIVFVTTKDWSHQSHFNTDLARLASNDAVYVSYRSPFIICNYPSNGEVEESKNPPCTKYRPFGRGKTSCESPPALTDENAINYGDDRLCQQIHFAGNLAISSAVFLGVALLVTGVMIALSLNLGSKSKSTHHNADAALEISKSTGEHHGSHSSSVRESKERLQWLNVFLLFCLVVGIIQVVMAQYYGTLAFIMSAPDNGEFSTRNGAPAPGVDTHRPWVQGKALSIFGSIAWLSGLLQLGICLLRWGLPRQSI